MNKVQYVTVSLHEEQQRLDNYLQRKLKGVPKSHIYRIIRSGEVRVNKGRAKPSTRLNAQDIIRIPPVRVAEGKAPFVGSRLKERLSQAVIFEDEQFLVLNKPSGVAVHAGSGVDVGVIEAIRVMRPDLDFVELAHRIDRETSGCLVLVKSRKILLRLHDLFLHKKVKKSYCTLLGGHWKKPSSVVETAPLKKNTMQSGERMTFVDESGKPAKTRFKLRCNRVEACWVDALPETGRTHQIRVHSAHLGHPIVGDSKYGGESWVTHLGVANRLYLHAQSIQFRLDGQTYHFEAEFDEAFKHALAALEKMECLK